MGACHSPLYPLQRGSGFPSSCVLCDLIASDSVPAGLFGDTVNTASRMEVRDEGINSRFIGAWPTPSLSLPLPTPSRAVQLHVGLCPRQRVHLQADPAGGLVF